MTRLSTVERITSMPITGSTRVADIATENPATIKVFQRHRIDFCCGGKVPPEEACRRKDLEAPEIVAPESEPESTHHAWRSIGQPIEVMEAGHAEAGAALERIAALTGGYVPPADACPTFRGLYHGLEELEREMHLHVHLENHILFPRAAALVRDRS